LYRILITTNSKNSNLIKERKILNKYLKQVAQKSWAGDLHLKTLKILISKLKNISKRGTEISIYNKGELFLKIGNKNDYYFKFKKIKDKYEKILEFIGKYHDLGKKSIQFQDIVTGKKDSLSQYFIRHEYLSVLYLEFLYKKEIQKEENRQFSSFLNERIKDGIFIDIDEKKDIYSVLFAIATHHKLPNTDKFGSAINEGYVYIDNLNDIKRGNVDIDNKDKQNIIKFFREIEKEQEQEDPFVLRATLMFGDHLGSSVDYIKRQKLSQAKLKEKFKKTKWKAKDIKKFQSYTEHSKQVVNFTKRARTVFKENIFSKWFGEYNSFIFETTDIEKFKWQKNAIDFVKENRRVYAPTLTILGSSTGTGKTRFGAKLHLLINKFGRLTILNGLRTLTLQAGTAYKEFGVFEENEISVLIGSKEVKKIYEADDMDSKDDDLNVENLSVEYKRNGELLNYFNEEYLTRDKEKFLDTPLLICTLDYLMKATNINKGKYVLPLLRLKSSDIFVDEIDSLGVQDQNAFLNFVYFCGLNKVNLTISTASIYPELIKKIETAYKEGVNGSYNLFYLSDKENFHGMGDTEITDIYQKIGQNREYSLKNKVEIKDLTIDNMFETAISLHKDNNEAGLSIGLIRIANIQNIFSVIDNFIEKIENVNMEIELIAYHSDFTLIERSFIEKYLDALLNRKKEKLKDKKPFKGKKEKTIIVIASPVEEVGRDHDFDWAIIEPSSLTSIVQTIGRVFRHRDRQSNKTNVIVMDRNFRLQGGREICYHRPGLENKKHLFLTDNEEKNLSAFVAKNEVDYLQTNKHIYKPEGNLLSIFEKEVIKDEIDDSNYAEIKEDIYGGLLNTSFYRPFRQNKSKTYNGYIDENEECWLFVEDNNSYMKVSELNYKKTTEYEYKVNKILSTSSFSEYKNNFIKTPNDYKRFNSFQVSLYTDDILKVEIIYKKGVGIRGKGA